MFRRVLRNWPAAGAENGARWAALKNQINPVAGSRNGVPSPELHPVQLAVDCTTLLTVLLPANTLKGRPLVTRPWPVTSHPLTMRLTSPEEPASQCLPLPNGISTTQLGCR